MQIKRLVTLVLMLSIQTVCALPLTSGAGLLIYAERNGIPSLLVAKKTGNGCWGDLGGTYEMVDFDAHTNQLVPAWAAAREGAEELALILDGKESIQNLVSTALANQNSIDVSSTQTYKTLLNLIDKKRLATSGSSFLVDASDISGDLTNDHFLAHKKMLLQAANTHTKKRNLSKVAGFLEMEAIAWIPLEQLINELQKRHRRGAYVQGKRIDPHFLNRLKGELEVLKRLQASHNQD